MARILINGVNSKAGGGKSILNNYLSLLNQSHGENRYYVLVPDAAEYTKYATDCVEILDVPRLWRAGVLFPFLLRVIIPKLVKDLKIDCIFNLGDVVIPASVHQVYLFDWAYAVYPESIAWKRMGLRNLLQRRVKLAYFKKYLSYATIVAAQSVTMKRRLESLYGLKNVELVPNAVALDNMTGGEERDYKFPRRPYKFLYLTHYYTHKNIEVMLPLARRIQQEKLPFVIIITVDTDQHVGAKRLIEQIDSLGLGDIVINIGSVRMQNVPSLYLQCDALLMPTLLESFSGTYVEAMFHRKPILTSNYEFAKDVCGEWAYYFDPLDVNSILSQMVLASTDGALRDRRISLGHEELGRMLTWEQVFSKFNSLIAYGQS